MWGGRGPVSFLSLGGRLDMFPKPSLHWDATVATVKLPVGLIFKFFVLMRKEDLKAVLRRKAAVTQKKRKT